MVGVMKLAGIILIGICSLRCLASQLPPFAGQCALVDRVFEAAGPRSPTREVALRILELVVLGKTDSADARLEVRAGLFAGQLQGSEFRSETVRAHALRRIGEAELPEVLEFLQNLKKEDLDPDESARLWPTVSVAMHQARLNRIPGQAAQIAFLEDTVNERHGATEWAVQELCDRGSYSSLPLIRKSLWGRTSDAGKQITYCEARIAVLSQSPDRIAALGSSLNEQSIDRRLIVWAVNQLYSMKSDRADAELRRYLAELESLPYPPPGPDLVQQLREMLARRGK